MVDENSLIIELYNKLPKKVVDGKDVIDFSSSKIIPFVLGFVFYNDEILLMKRSTKVGSFVGLWHVFAGHLDEVIPAKQKILEEVIEEGGFLENDFLSIKKLENIYIENSGKQDWLLIPFVLELGNKRDPKLNWEHDEYKWVEIAELDNEKELVPGIKDLILKATSIS